MQKSSYWSLVFMFLGAGCSSQSDSIELANTFWATEILYDKKQNEFTSNMIFSFGNDTASIHQFGTGKKLFELPYLIKKDKLYLDRKPNPFLKFLQKKNDKIIVSFYTGDTIVIKQVYPKANIKEVIKSELLNQSFVYKKERIDETRILYFEDKEVLQFSKDIENENAEFVNFNFTRVPYSIDFTNGIPTIIIGNQSSPKVEMTSNSDYGVSNIIVGELDKKEKNRIEINSFVANKVEKSTLTKVENKNNQISLTSGEWKRGSNLMFRFEPDGRLEITEKGMKRELNWKADNSGYLIIMEEKSGEKLYAIKNFKLHEKRIGLEFSRGKFGDILNLK